MKDFLPDWLEDPSAFAQPANLDMSTVLLVAGGNLCVGCICVTIFEVFRRRNPDMYSPKEKLLPGSTPRVMHVSGSKPGTPLSWVRPLMSLNEEDVLRCGGYDVLVYLRFIKLAIHIFGSFAPYAFVVLLPVNASVFYLVTPGDKLPNNEVGAADISFNTFNRLSLSSMPIKDSRMWTHCVGVYLLTGLTMHFLARECRWYTRLRHRFLTERDEARQRTVLFQQVPIELRSSPKLAEYFARLYPGKVVGAVMCRRTDRLDRLVAARATSLARFERIQARRTRHKLTKPNVGTGRWNQCNGCIDRYNTLLEDAYDPCWWRCDLGLTERSMIHETSIRRLDEKIETERRNQASVDPLVGRPSTKYPDSLPCSIVRTTAAVVVEGAVVASVNDSVPPVDGQVAATVDVETPKSNFISTTFPKSDSSQDAKIKEDDANDHCSQLADDTHHSLALEGCWDEEDSIASHCALICTRCGPCCSRLHKHGAEAAALLGAERGKARLIGDKAFVCFNSFKGAAIATQVFHAATPGGMHAQMAPEPRDIFWPNVHVSSKRRTTRRVIANAIVALLLIFYIVPVTLISLVLSDQAIKARWPAVRRYAEKSIIAATVVKMMQPTALIALMLLLPPLFLGLGFWEGHFSWSANTLSQLSRYYSFQITNVLLVTTIAGSILKCLEKIIENPKMTFRLLGESLPQVCAFFSCYIFIKAFSGLTIELCRAVAAVQQVVKRLIYPSSTARDRTAEVIGLRDFENPGWFSYGKFGAQDLLVVVLLMTYSVMAPIILVPGTTSLDDHFRTCFRNRDLSDCAANVALVHVNVCRCLLALRCRSAETLLFSGMLFFAIASVVYRHQLLYVYTPIFESGGLLWPRIYRRILFSLFILHFTMTGIFWLKRAYYQGYCVLALSCLTYFYKVHMRAVYVTSSSVAHYLPIELATAVDNAMQHEPEAHFDENNLANGLAEYLQPALLFP